MKMNNPADIVAYVGLGSNLGDKATNIKQALALLDAAAGVRLKQAAPFYRTAPVGYTKQDWFINTVAEIYTELPPHTLLTLLLTLEKKLGRVRLQHWGPRTIDLDLLLYGSEIITTKELVVPHPHMHERAFVMVPLADLAPDIVIPGRGKAAELAQLLAQEQIIEPI